MKKSSLIVLLLTASTAMSAISPRVVAQAGKDCPPVPKEGIKVVINNDQAFLRTSPKADGKKNLAYVATKNSSLEFLKTKPIFQGENCWYQVKPPEDRTEKELWIADTNFSPFSKADAQIGETSTNDPSTGKTTTTKVKLQEKEDSQKATSLDWSSIGLGIILFLGFSTTGVFLYTFLKRLNNVEHKINIENDKINLKIAKFQAESRQNSEQISTIQVNTNLLERKLKKQNLTLSDEMYELVEKFNIGNKDSFSDVSRFRPVKLSRESIQGSVGIDGRRTIRFEQAEPTQGAYLEFSADGENWLIPNITSIYFNGILNQLSENQEIFTFNEGSGSIKLIRPAKLKSVSGGVWKIAEPGEFGDRYQPEKVKSHLNLQPHKNEENYSKLAEQLGELQKKYNTLESTIPKSAPLKETEENYTKLAEKLSELQKKYNTLESKIPKSPPSPNPQPVALSQNKPSTTPQSVQSTVELSIMNYLKKNGNSTFYQLRLGIECEEQILRQSLINLDREDYINVEISPDHNVIYKVE